VLIYNQDRPRGSQEKELIIVSGNQIQLISGTSVEKIEGEIMKLQKVD